MNRSCHSFFIFTWWVVMKIHFVVKCIFSLIVSRLFTSSNTRLSSPGIRIFSNLEKKLGITLMAWWQSEKMDYYFILKSNKHQVLLIMGNSLFVFVKILRFLNSWKVPQKAEKFYWLKLFILNIWFPLSNFNPEKRYMKKIFTKPTENERFKYDSF